MGFMADPGSNDSLPSPSSRQTRMARAGAGTVQSFAVVAVLRLAVK